MIASACRRPAALAPSDASRSAAPAEWTESSAATSPGGDQALPEGYCRPATIVAMGRGGAILDACFDPTSNRTDLIGQRVDADAMVVGARVRLARVDGTVLSLAATVVDGTIRVAWIARVGEGADRSDESIDRGGGARELSTLTVTPTFEVPGAPVRVNRFTVPARAEAERRGWIRSRVELAPGPELSLLLLATDAEGDCTQAGPRCATWSLFSVASDGAVSRIRHEFAPSPSLEPQSLTRVGSELAYLRGSDAVRNTLFIHSVRTDGSALSSVPAAGFDPLVDWTSGSLAWTGTALVALGEARAIDAAEAHLVVRVTSISGPSPTRSRATDDPEVVRWPAVTERSWRCVRRHPVVHIAWRGGAIDLDPTMPGASIDLSRWVPTAVAGIPGRTDAPRWMPPMAWTGRALLAIDGQDRLRRWTCPRDGQAPTE